MAVTINAKGTSVSSFAIGKDGLTLSQSGTLTPPAGNDLVISLDDDKTLVIDAGTEAPALITTSNDQDLHINPATGGGQYLVLVANRWPTADGTSGQVLTTNGAGILSFTTVSGTAAPTVVIVSGTSQSAAANNHYVLTNTGAATTVTLPASPADGDIIWVMNATSRTDHVIARNGQLLQGVAEDMTINIANVNIQLRFINTTVGWRIL